MPNYIDIKSVTGSDSRLVKQDLKFRTGKFLWKVNFNIPLNPETVNDQNLAVLNSQGTRIKTGISYGSEDNSINIEPLEPYAADEVYTLVVSTNVESKGGQKLKNEVSIEFTI